MDGWAGVHVDDHWKKERSVQPYRTGQVRTGQLRTGQVRAGQVCAGQVRTD